MRDLSLLLSLTDCGRNTGRKVVDLGVFSTRKKRRDGMDFGVTQTSVQILVVSLTSL